MDLVIEKPQELYDEIGRQISNHYNVAAGYDDGHKTFTKSYPELYRIYLGLAARGIRCAPPH